MSFENWNLIKLEGISFRQIINIFHSNIWNENATKQNNYRFN
jgi:hypothetical protein